MLGVQPAPVSLWLGLRQIGTMPAGWFGWG